MENMDNMYIYYRYNPYRGEYTAGIVVAQSVATARSMLALKYANVNPNNWKISETEFKNNICEVFYG